MLAYKIGMKKEEEKQFKIICIKAPKWMRPFLKPFVKKGEK